MQPLAAVFMMNNLHYMVKTVESSEALTVLGEEWIEQHKDQARACASCSQQHFLFVGGFLGEA